MSMELVSGSQDSLKYFVKILSSLTSKAKAF